MANTVYTVDKCTGQIAVLERHWVQRGHCTLSSMVFGAVMESKWNYHWWPGCTIGAGGGAPESWSKWYYYWWMLVGAPESWCGIPPRLPKYPPPFSAVLSVVGCEAIQLKYTFSIAFKDQLYRIT